jgi:ABC-type branched-subunit amino acid transport system substrate-binding protein
MKKWLSVAGVMVLCLALVIGVACGGGGEDEEGVKEVKFGIGLPLSGLYGAVIGIPAKQGFELANEYIGEFTVAGESYKWNLIFEDNGWDSEGGIASATKLIFDNGVDIMTQIGGDPALAAQPICEESGVILFTTGIPLEAYGPDKPHTFLGQSFVFANSATLFKYISEAHPEVKTVSVVFEDTAIGRVTGEAIIAAAEYFGLEVLAPEYYPPGTVEFYPTATKMANKNPDMCYMDTRVLEPMRELGWEGIPFYTLWGSTYGDSIGWDKVQGYLIFYPVPLGEGLHEALRPMAAEYEQRFGAEFGQLSWFYALQLYYMTDVLKKARTVDDVDQIIATLETETFDTPAGPVKFGLRELEGIGHLFMMPCWIGEIRGEEYHVVFEMSTDEAEALAIEIFGK